MHFHARCFVIVLLAGATCCPSLLAQVKLPKAPERFDVEFRYSIRAGRNERIVQFTEMMKYLDRLGFKRNETEDSDLDIFNPDAERMSGTIPSANARKLLDESHIQTVLLAPAGFKPADEKDRAKVLIELNNGFPLQTQRQFRAQTKDALAPFNFEDAVGYDHRGFTLLRGVMPWQKTRALLKDLRGQPSGWFLPLIHEIERPALFNSKLPIRLIEIQPEEGAPAPVMGQAPLPPPPPDRPYVAKLSADLRRRLEQAKDAPLRVEVTLNFEPNILDPSWKAGIMLANPSTAIEGRIGNVVTLTVTAADQVNALARLAFVVSIRLPRAAETPAATPAAAGPTKEEPKENARGRGRSIAPVQAVEPLDVLKATRVDRLHARGGIGTGVRVAVIDTDFTGWERFRGNGLPLTTTYVDLTAERNSEIQPEPSSTPKGRIGHGTQCALAVRLAAPDADIALVRVVADAPYQIVTVFRYTLGDFFQPESFRVRRDELENDAGALRNEQLLANALYRKAFDDFTDDEEARERRRNAKAAIAAVSEKERLLTERANRLLKLERELTTLGGTKVVLNLVGWGSGQPLDATSALSRFLDGKMTVAKPNPVLNAAKRPQPSLWFQPAGDTRGQAWLGPFLDVDGNGIMEFLPPGAPLKPGRWTPELNFLAFRSPDQADATDLPAETRLRITIQWREPHDPEIDESEYRQPIAPLHLLLLRQRDPNGEKLPSDEMEVMARSEGAPERLLVEREFGIYEQKIELTLPAAGRYAVRVDGKQPIGIRPGGTLGFRDQEIYWELKPRLFLEVTDAPTRAKGRVVFGDYESFLGGVAVPADARSVVAVGAMHADRRPEPFSALGAGLCSDLLVKPDVMTYDQLPQLGDGTGPARGSDLSAALAAGIGACLLSAGAESADFLRYLRIPPGHIFDVPPDWIKK
jgi:hypothetical protein